MNRGRNAVSLAEYDELRKNARMMRKNMTVVEKILWYQVLKKLPVRFLRQKIIYYYIVDFYCAKAKLIVEVDGIQHTEKENKEYDAKRTAFLKNRGYKVIRFSNSEIVHDVYGVEERIKEVLEERLGEEV
jgi:very-short-patch-repair endonuclease